MKMTIFRNRQHKKRTSIQRKLIYSIAIEGHLSKPKAVKRITSYYANVHEAFKTLEEDKIIQFSYTNLKSRRAEWYFKLTDKGFLEFIEQTPSPYEFWTASIWFCGLRDGSVNKDEFERYWNLYLHKYIGGTLLNGCFFHHDFLENLFGEWRKNIWDTHKIKTDRKTRLCHKVLECLAEHRSITIEQLSRKTELAEEDVNQILDSYTMGQQNVDSYTREYELSNLTDYLTSTTYGFVNHLIIVSKQEKESIKYELSLIGVLVALSIITFLSGLPKEDSINPKLPNRLYRDRYQYYSIIASNYKDKLPLIFGNWKILSRWEYSDIVKSTLQQIFFRSSRELFCAPIIVGGNKEVHDNIHSATLNVFWRLEEVHDALISALEFSYPKQFIDRSHLKLIKQKLNEIRLLLRYSSIQNFAKYMRNRQSRDINRPIILTTEQLEAYNKKRLSEEEEPFAEENRIIYEEELSAIENIFAEEFTTLFYLGLFLDTKDHIADYPFNTGFVPKTAMRRPKDLLMDIINNDTKVKDKLEIWLNEAKDYQQKTLDKMDEIFGKILPPNVTG